MKRAPAARSISVRAAGFAAKKRLSRAAAKARIRHHIVPVVTKVAPSARKSSVLEVLAGLMNCGRNARKNSATFGLSTLLTIPWANADQSPRRDGRGAASARGLK